MFLSFIGSGSALNTSLGNNSAFIKHQQSMLLIDCGSTTFSSLQALNLLVDVKNLYVFITHRHPDHIASLGDLIFYAHYKLNTEVNIFTPDSENIITILKYMGVENDLYNIITLDGPSILSKDAFKISIDYVQVPHVADMPCYGYIISYGDTIAYYSGDASDIPAEVIDCFNKNEIHYIYQDVCSYDYPNNPHMYIDKLSSLIPQKDRSRIYCMHYDEESNKKSIEALGFKLIENYV